MVGGCSLKGGGVLFGVQGGRSNPVAMANPVVDLCDADSSLMMRACRWLSSRLQWETLRQRSMQIRCPSLQDKFYDGLHFHRVYVFS
eukprot:768633-Hanusia_phi.AAC.4